MDIIKGVFVCRASPGVLIGSYICIHEEVNDDQRRCFSQ